MGVVRVVFVLVGDGTLTVSFLFTLNVLSASSQRIGFEKLYSYINIFCHM